MIQPTKSIDDPMLAEAIQLLTENFQAFKSRRKFGEVGVVIKFEDGTPVRGEEICSGTFKRKPKA